jgi:N-acyl-D-amino-acid deacylase
MADLLVKNGTIVDGTGAKAYAADLRIKDGVIVEIGQDLDSQGEHELDASGAFVAPGFIDGHTHVDPALWWDQSCDPLPGHGVTTVVTGNCSLSLAPIKLENKDILTDMFCFIEDIPNHCFDDGIPWNWSSWAEYKQAFNSHGAAVNVVPLVGHSALRLHVIGEQAFERASTDSERKEIAALTEECLKAGAFGLSTSFVDVDRRGRPVPSRAADNEEFAAMVAKMKDLGRGLFEFVPRLLARDTQIADIERVHNLCRDAGIPATWTQLYLGDNNKDWIEPLLTQAERTLKEGPGVYAQVSPRSFDNNLSMVATSMFSAIPAWHDVVQADSAGKRALLEDEEWRAQARRDYDSDRPSNFPKNCPERVIFSRTIKPELQQYIEKSLADYAEYRNLHLSDALAEWVLLNDLDPGITLRSQAYDADKICELMKHPATILSGTDFGAHVQMMCGAGDTTLMIERFVTERGDYSLEEAIKGMTSDLAQLFGIFDRGVLVQGMAGDLAIFSTDEIDWPGEFMVDDLPGGASRLTRPGGGYRATVVSGVPTYLNGEYTHDLPGRMLEPLPREVKSP